MCPALLQPHGLQPSRLTDIKYHSRKLCLELKSRSVLRKCRREAARSAGGAGAGVGEIREGFLEKVI